MNEDVTFRWLDGPTCTDREWAAIEEVLSKRNWMSLSRDYSKIFVAESNGELAFCVFQGIPYCGPLYVPPKLRGTGIAKKLANGMIDWLIGIGSRGWIAIAQSPHTVKFCESRGMVRVNYPVYMMPLAGGLNVDIDIRGKETEE